MSYFPEDFDIETSSLEIKIAYINDTGSFELENIIETFGKINSNRIDINIHQLKMQEIHNL